MNVPEARKAVEQALATPVTTWLGYSPYAIPLVLYDDDEFVFLNHPSPPAERPDQLTAATALAINGVMTALIPVALYADEQALIPLVYHECFHVFQNTGAFHFAEEFDFFRALAFYPELKVTYRALCASEAEILNNAGLSVQEQAAYLAALSQRRHQILAESGDVLLFEKSSERREGTASYVEQMARAALWGRTAEPLACHYGWARQYSIGAAACQLLDRLQVAAWQAQVQAGAAPTEILIERFGPADCDLAALHLAEKEAREAAVVSQTLATAQAEIAALDEKGALRVQLLANGPVFRSFNPMGIVSLGDGRLLHRQFLIIQMPNGQITIHNDLALEDYARGEVLFRSVPLQTVDGRIEANTETVQLLLSNVANNGQGVLKLQ